MLIMFTERNNTKHFRLKHTIIVFYVTVQCSFNLVRSNDCHSTKDQSKTDKLTDFCEKQSMADTQSSNALAVMLYNEDSLLPLHRQERKFTIVGHDITIKQDWSGLGVAAVVWDAAEVLCRYLEEYPDVVKDKAVIELGAGTGLVGMATALLDGKVTITDRQEVLQFLTKTVETNLPEPFLQNAQILALDWTDDLSHMTATDHSYDVILGADIVYIEEAFDDLLRTLIRLSSPETLILLSCRIRYDRDTNFLTRLEDHFVVNKILYDKVTDVVLYKAIKR